MIVATNHVYAGSTNADSEISKGTAETALLQDSNLPDEFAENIDNLAIADSSIPVFIDEDITNADVIFKEGGNMQYVSTDYDRNKTIGEIFTWTSSDSVRKSSGFHIGATISIHVFGTNMTANANWSTDTTRTWNKPKGCSQFRVLAKGDIQVKKYRDTRVNNYYYVKKTINLNDVKQTR